MEEAVSRRHGHERGAFGATSRLAKDQDAGRVAAELGDVLAHPFERENQVEHAHIAGVGILFGIDCAEI